MQFDHEKLDVYQQELRFITWTTSLLAKIKISDKKSRFAEVADQLDRASLSALLNTAEANGKRQRQGRAKFFDDARGSATECAACLDALVAKGLCEHGDIREGKEILLRIVSMLTKLVQHFDESDPGSCRVREDSPEYGAPPDSSSSSKKSSDGEEGKEIEHEDEDEDENENERKNP